MYLGYQNGRIITYTKTIPDKEIYNLEKIEETDDEYVYIENDDCMGGHFYKMTPEVEEILKQKERARKDRLSLTSADVERAIYKAKGMDFDDIIELARRINEQQEQVMLTNEETVGEINSVETTDETKNTEKEVPSKIDIKALKIELKANNFYRGHPYIEQIGKLLGYTSEDLDYLFENGKLPEKEQIPE